MAPILLNRSSSWFAPGAGITQEATDCADCTSEVLPASMWLFCISAATLGTYNAIEFTVMVFLTFQKYRGLYFYSLLVSGLAVIPYYGGFVLHLLDITTGNTRWIAITLITIGWWPMVTGQAVVLWSRLHLILFGGQGERIMMWTKWMIVTNAIVLHIPTTVFTYGVNGNFNEDQFATGYNIMEKIQMTIFLLQELILSTIYIVETFKLLQTSLKADTRTTMRQLFTVNALIIIMDLGLLGMEAASLYILETMVKGVVYSIKLKLELAVLGKLVSIVGGSRNVSAECSTDPRKSSVGFVVPPKSSRAWGARLPEGVEDEGLAGMDIAEFVDLSRLSSGRDVTRASQATRDASCSKGVIEGRRRTEAETEDHEFARFEHVEDVSTLVKCRI